jgi:hypothetical protein
MTIEDIRSREQAELIELKAKLENACNMATGTMGFHKDGISGPQINVKRSRVAHYEQLIRTQEALIGSLDHY